MLQWFHSNGDWLIPLAIVSVGSLLVTLVTVPVVVLRLPRDYFCHDRREPSYRGWLHPAVGLVLVILKNAVGAVLVAVGVVMIFTPGQGLLAILLGAMLLNFPGKYRFERWLVRQNGLLPAMNWLRSRYGRPPLDPPA
jgi:uncharacterized membrane protein YbaN (DUF454 family)